MCWRRVGERRFEQNTFNMCMKSKAKQSDPGNQTKYMLCNVSVYKQGLGVRLNYRCRSWRMCSEWILPNTETGSICFLTA